MSAAPLEFTANPVAAAQSGDNIGQAIRDAAQEARQAAQEATQEALQDAAEEMQDARQELRDAQQEVRDAQQQLRDAQQQLRESRTPDQRGAANQAIFGAEQAVREAERALRRAESQVRTRQETFTLQPPGGDFRPVIPPQAVDIAIGFFITCAVMVIGWPISRALGRRMERRGPGPALEAAAVPEQLQRIEQAVEAIAIEVERISESQRFLTRLKEKSGSAAD